MNRLVALGCATLLLATNSAFAADAPLIVIELPGRTLVPWSWWRIFKALRIGLTRLDAVWLNTDGNEDAEGCLVFHLAPESEQMP